MTESRYDQGLRIRTEVAGDEYVQRAFARAGEFGKDFQDLVTEYCWGASWGRETLTRRDRSLLNLAILSTLGRSEELATHTRGALRNGVSTEEIKDTLIHVAVYAGIPAGVEAFRVAGEVLAAAAADAAPPAPAEPATAPV